MKEPKCCTVALSKYKRWKSCRVQWILLLITVLVIVAIITKRSLKNQLVEKVIEVPPEYEEYTYESLLNEFHNVTQINPHPYIYIHSPTHICTMEEDVPTLLILVKSDVTNFSYRMGIRSTWGNFSSLSFKLVFLIGFSTPIQNMVKVENDKYHDLVQENFVDAYRNNTIKTIMAFNWATRYCPGAEYLLFVDDDYFVNLNNIEEFIQTNGSSQADFFVGNRIDKARVFRYEASSWYMTRKEYPFAHYPSYISGGSLLLSMKTAMVLKNAFPYIRYLYIDDVYLGITAYILHIKLMHDDRFSTVFLHDGLEKCLATHDYGSPDNLLKIWKEFLHNHYDNTVTIYENQMKDLHRHFK